MRYDEASYFFFREMELKRKYRDASSPKGIKIQKNDWLRRNFSLTGLYHHLFRYGESIRRIAPTIIGFYISSILYWVVFDSPTLHTSFSVQSLTDSVSKASERSLSNIFQFRGNELEPMDYFVSIASLALLGIVIIALKRKFERKYGTKQS